MTDEPQRRRLDCLEDVRFLDNTMSEAMALIAHTSVSTAVWSKLSKVSKALHAERVEMDRMMSDIPMTRNA